MLSKALMLRYKYLAYLGLVPYSSAPALQRRQKYYTCIVIMLNLLLAVYGLISYPNFNDLKVSLVVNQLVFVTQTFCATIVICEVMYNYATHFEYYEHVKSLKQQFQTEVNASMQTFRRRLYHKYLFGALLSYGTLVLTIIAILGHFYYGYFRFAIVSLIILRTRCLQVMLHIDYITFFLEILASNLQAVVEARDSTNPTSLLSLAYLLKLKTFYNSIYKLSWRLNEHFGWSMLLLFVVMVIDIILHLYWLFLTLMKVYPFEFNLINILTITPQLVLISMFCKNCEYCKQLHTIITNYVRRLSNTLHKHTDMAIYNDILDEFAVQLQQECIEVTAKGFITIDYRLLMSMFTGITAYLTILMQFRISDADYVKHKSLKQLN